MEIVTKQEFDEKMNAMMVVLEEMNKKITVLSSPHVEYLSLKEACQYIGRGETWMRSMVKKKRIRAIRPGDGPRTPYKFRRKLLDEDLASMGDLKTHEDER